MSNYPIVWTWNLNIMLLWSKPLAASAILLTSHLCSYLHAALQCSQWFSVLAGLSCQHLVQLHFHLVQPLPKQPAIMRWSQSSPSFCPPLLVWPRLSQFRPCPPVSTYFSLSSWNCFSRSSISSRHSPLLRSQSSSSISSQCKTQYHHLSLHTSLATI